MTKLDKILMEMSFSDEKPEKEANLKEDLGIDSLRMAELIIAIEDAYMIVFDESDLDPAQLATAADLYDLVGKYSGGD